MSSVMAPGTAAREPAAVRKILRLDKSFVWGEGSRIRDAAGREYLDFNAGCGGLPFGHNHPTIWEAVFRHRNASEPAIAEPSHLGPAARLAERLIGLAPCGLDHVHFTNSGPEALDAAISACRLATGRTGVVAALNSSHGAGRPLTPALVPYGDAAALDTVLQAQAGQIAAVILEPVQCDRGIVVAPDGYLAAAREIATRHGACLVLDESQTGLGRTGVMFASAAANVRPDCLTVAGALGGGIVPLGACLFAASAWPRDRGLRQSNPPAGNPPGGNPPAGNPLAWRTALAALDLLTGNDGSLLDNVRRRADQIAATHAALHARFPNVVAPCPSAGLLLGLAIDVRRDSFATEWGTYLGVFGEQGNIVPLLASYLLNVEGICSAPALDGSNVLRITPPLTVTEAECDAYAAGIGRAVGLLAQGNTGALAAHLVDTAPLPRLPRSRRLIARQKAEPRPDGDEGRFAFLVHPLDIASLVSFDESLRVIQPEGLAYLGEALAGFLDPFPIGATRVVTEDGTTAYGEFICVPRTAEQFQRMPQPEAQRLVAAAVDMARDRGAKIVGLGGYTSVVTLGGTRVTDRGVAITTGNGFTLVSAIAAADLACRRLGIALDGAGAAVVGAGGAIGSGVVGCLFDRVAALTLVGRSDRPDKTRRRFEAVLTRCLNRLLTNPPKTAGLLAQRIMAHPNAPSPAAGEAAIRAFAVRLLDENGARVPLRWSLDIGQALSDAQVVVCATSSAEELIRPEHVRPGTVLCDMSRPSNVSRRIADERPDVLVLDGGIVEVPGRPDFGFDLGVPRGLSYACLAETIMLSLHRHHRHTSIGSDLSRADQDLLADLAARYGFRLAGLRSFDRLLTEVDWQGLREQRDRSQTAGFAAPPRITPDAGQTAVPQYPGSVEPGDATNAAGFLLDRHLDARGDKTAVVDSHGERHSYRKLHAMSAGMSHLLRTCGVGQGDPVAVVSHDSVEGLAVLLGAMRIGAVTVLLNPELRPDALQEHLRLARPVLVFAPPAALADVARSAAHVGIAALPLTCPDAPPREAMEPVALRADTPAVCLFSSGTTGRPKGILHTHRDLLNTNLNYARLIGLTADDTLFSGSKMFFAYGLNAVHFALFAGATSVLAPQRVVPGDLLRRMETERTTVFFGVPTIFLLMLDRQDRAVDLGALRLCVSAGEPLPEDVYDAWTSRFGTEMIDGIGSTETLSTFLTNLPSANHPGTLATVVPGFEVKLLAETAAPAADGEIGTLWVRGNTVADRYLGDAADTTGVFSDGWFNTNDLFVRDDRQRYTFIGRAVDTFKVGGMWVSPLVVEAAIARHPAVQRCAVVKHIDFGKLIRPKAFVVPHQGVEVGAGLVAEIKEFVRHTLARHQYPHLIEFVSELPLTVTGKIQRYRLAAQENAPPAHPRFAETAPSEGR